MVGRQDRAVYMPCKYGAAVSQQMKRLREKLSCDKKLSRILTRVEKRIRDLNQTLNLSLRSAPGDPRIHRTRASWLRAFV